MTKQSFNLLGSVVFGLLINAAILPAYAAPSASKGEQKPFLPANVLEVAFVGAISVTALSVLVGTGKSIKYRDGVPESEHAIEAVIPSVHEEEHHRASHTHTDNHQHQPVNSAHSLQGTSAKDLEIIAGAEKNSSLSKKINYRQEYLNLQEQVRKSPDFANNPSWEVDPWEIDVEIVLMVLSNSLESKEEVEKVLLQSDQVLEWQTSLPDEEYLEKASEYIDKTYNWAKDLYEWRKDKTNVKPSQRTSMTNLN